MLDAAAHLRRVRADRRGVAAINRFVSAAAARMGIRRRRGLWTTRIVRSGREPFCECWITVHRYDPMCLLASHVRGCVRGALPVDGRLDQALGYGILFKLANLARCRRWEAKLEANGRDAASPPAEVYATDLITRRLLDAWGVDGEVLVAAAPCPIRSRRWTIGPTAAASWYGSDIHAIIPVESPALAEAFPPMVCDFDLGFLHTRSISLDGEVRVTPNGRHGRAEIFIPHRLPETLSAAVKGLPFRDVVAHDALDDPALIIVGMTTVPMGTLVEVSDPMVRLVGPVG